jgi:hypothetical protein
MKVKILPILFSMSNDIFCSLHRWKNVCILSYFRVGWDKIGI